MEEVFSMHLMAMIYVDSVENARDFYVGKLGFTHLMGMLGKDGLLDFCTVVMDGARIMLMRPQTATGGTSATAEARPVEFYLQVADVDSYCEQVKKQGIRLTDPLTDQWWGDRTFKIKDPYGYQIWFYQNVGDVVLPQGAKVV